MLSWSAGPGDSDDVWVAHWYKNVDKSTLFLPYKKNSVVLSKQQQWVADQSRPFYEQMYRDRI